MTGGSRGIGKAVVALFASFGAHVAVNYVRDEEAAMHDGGHGAITRRSERWRFRRMFRRLTKQSGLFSKHVNTSDRSTS